MPVHLVGVGDYSIHSIIAIDDPCPLPSQSGMSNGNKSSAIPTGNTSLKKRGSLLYAPFANVGLVKMDQDGVYIDIKNVIYTKPDLLVSTSASVPHERTDDEGNNNANVGLVRQMQDASVAMDRRLDESELSLFAGSSGVSS
eukprot:gene2984-3659_t